MAPPQQYSAVAAVSVVKTLPPFKLIYIQLASLWMSLLFYAEIFICHFFCRASPGNGKMENRNLQDNLYTLMKAEDEV